MDNSRFPNPGTIFEAMVLDCTQEANCYHVVTSLGADMMATDLTRSGLPGIGPQEYGLYAPGTKVLCFQSQVAATAHILGSVAEPMADSQVVEPGWILPFGGTSIEDHPAHGMLLNLPGKGGVVNFNNGRPRDAVCGDFGVFNCLNVGWNMSQSSLTFRAGHLAELTFHYLDNLVRLNSINLQLWTGASDTFSGNDEGECMDLVRVGLFPWELNGMPAPGVNFAEHKDSYGVETAGNVNAFYEPLHPDQLGIFRLQQFRGFLGDVERVQVSCPPASLTGPERLSSATEHLGLSETIRHANGLLEFRSAKGLLFEKSLDIQVPKQMAAHDDPAGEDGRTAGYAFSGNTADADLVHDKGEPPLNGDGTAGDSPAQLLDYHAWLHKAYGAQSLQQHAKDWRLPGPTASDHMPAGDGTQFRLPLPVSELRRIDHRKDHTHRFFKSRSFFQILDDGSQVIEDAYGSQIIMTGGNIILAPRNDLLIQPGRSTISLSPRDVILRAGNSVDVSAAKGDVRIKAERNLHALAGNSGSGGILLESRSTSSSQSFPVSGEPVSNGIVFLSRESDVRAYAKNVYLRSGDGSLTLDANGGLGDLTAYAASSTEFLSSEKVLAFGPAGGSAQVAEVHTLSSVVMGQPGSLQINASTVTLPTAKLLVGGALYAASLARRGGRAVGEDENGAVGAEWGDSVEEQMQQATADMTAKAGTAVAQTQARAVNNFREGGIGDPALLNNMGFSFRTDYGVVGVALTETRWQQFNRLVGSTRVWQEPIVSSPGGVPTMPFPGHADWCVRSTYRMVNPTYWTPVDGDLPAASAYRDPRLPTPVTGIPNQTYNVTLQ
jgi:hypothetical protein